MQAGKGGDTVNPWGARPLPDPEDENPKSATEQAAYGKWLDQRTDREQGRSDRLHGAEGIIPGSIWLVLFLIAGVVFAFMLFFADSGEGVPSQAMLMGSATTVIVLTLAAINALDNPYRAGLGQIKPVAMQRSLRILDAERAIVNDSAPVPCDARGTAVSSVSQPVGSSCLEKNCSALRVFVVCAPPRSMPRSARNARLSAATWKASPGAHFVESSRIRVPSG